jgi:hypothetical protein
MSCVLVNGLECVCAYSASGVERLWLANKTQISSVGYNATGVVTGITWSDTGQTFYEICPAEDSCTFQDDLQVNNSRKNFLQSVNFGVAALSASTLSTLETIGLAALVAIVKVADGTYRMLGNKGTGLRATVMTETSGTSAGNDAAFQVTVAGNATGKASFVAEALMTSEGLI